MKLHQWCLVGLCWLVASCTTTRPLTTKEITQQRIRDTLLLNAVAAPGLQQPIVITFHDTLRIEHETKIVNNTTAFDTSQFTGLFQQYQEQSQEQTEQLKLTIAGLQKAMLQKWVHADSNTRSVQQQAKLVDTLHAAQAIIATGEKITDVQLYVYYWLAAIALLVFLAVRYLRKRLKKQIAHLNASETSEPITTSRARK